MKLHARRLQQTCDAGSVHAAPARFRREEIAVACYENEVPSFVGAEVDRLYGHLYCSLSYFETARQLDGASTYVVRKDGTPVTVLLFRRNAAEVTVIGEFMTLDEEQIRRFADCMFDTYREVRVVTFPRVQTHLGRLPYPWHAINYTEDMVVTLPDTVKEYESSLGKNMKRNIKRYTSALERDFPSYSFRIDAQREVDEQDIREIIRLSCIRMESKNITPRFNEDETRWIIDFARQCGLVGVATIDGCVCAGAIGFRIGDNYFMHVIAHDPRYNGYSLGILCYYFTICEGIKRGGKLFHLLQGRYEYKHRLLAERRDIRHLDIYRNPVQAFVRSPRIFRKAVSGHLLAAKQWLLHDIERSDDRASRFIGAVVQRLRKRKRSRGVPERTDKSARAG
jgi:hypothetical protein